MFQKIILEIIYRNFEEMCRKFAKQSSNSKPFNFICKWRGLSDVLQRSRDEQTRMANMQRSGAMRLRQRAQVDEQYLSDQEELKRLRRQTQEQQEQLQALVDLQQP